MRTELVDLGINVKVASLLHVHQAGFNGVVDPTINLSPKSLHCVILYCETVRHHLSTHSLYFMHL